MPSQANGRKPQGTDGTVDPDLHSFSLPDPVGNILRELVVSLFK